MNIEKIAKSARKYLTNADYRFSINIGFGIYNRMPDEKYIKRVFKIQVGYDLNLENPQTFNEKLQWIKLYDRKSEYTMMVDKWAVRKYIANNIGPKHLIPLLGVWNNPDEIDFVKLPHQFVLKCNHNSGLGMFIVRDKTTLDVKKMKTGLRKGLMQDYYLTSREWPYKDVPRRIIAEKYIVDESKVELKDYKINCFNGEPKYIQVMSGRSNGQYYLNHFDMDWNPMIIPRKNHIETSQNIEKPKHLQEMIEISKVLSRNIPYVRIDLYHTEEQIYFGEITFFPMSGFVDYADIETDLALGKLIKLPLPPYSTNCYL